MNILILGGLSFLGRHLVEQGLERGHRITVFTRGQHNPDAYPEVEKLRGDRDGDLSALEGRRWDVAIDTSGYVPRVVRDSARLLTDAVDHYTFVSTINVYRDTSTPGIDERAAVARLDDPSIEEMTGESYGALKALCEEVVESELPGRTLIVRPGLIVGRYDPTDRFTYWPRRVAAGGEVLAPDKPQDPVQIIDAHDLASWMLDLAERRASGVFNATGPNYPLTIGQVLDESKAVSGSDAAFTWVPPEFLEKHEIQPWQDLPAWVPDVGEYLGFSRVDCRRAFAAGLTFRPLRDTIRDTREWASTFPSDHEWRAGLTRERERAALEAWHAETSRA
jgi:2'-hydroxyisoflavone reductase